jgi:beta-lactam-binding protein with PASTA domain
MALSKKNVVIIVLAVIVVLLLCCAAAMFAYMWFFMPGPLGDNIEIPDMVGMTVPEARDALSIRSEITVVESDAEPGTVVGQSHAPGTKTHHDDIVRLEVAGPLTVPDVVGEQTGDAQSELYAAGFDVIAYEYDPEATEAAGTILFVEPQAGDEVWSVECTLYIAGEYPYPEY